MMIDGNSIFLRPEEFQLFWSILLIKWSKNLLNQINKNNLKINYEFFLLHSVHIGIPDSNITSTLDELHTWQRPFIQKMIL